MILPSEDAYLSNSIEEYSELSMTWFEEKPKHFPSLSEMDGDWSENNEEAI